MARKTTTTQALDSDVVKELEKALDLDLAEDLNDGLAEGLKDDLDQDLSNGLKEEPDLDDDLDIAVSMEDLEAQISRAADELARESRNGSGNGNGEVAEKAEAEPIEPMPQIKFAPADPDLEPKHMPMGLRPADDPIAPPATTFSPANDDRQRDFSTVLSGLNRRSSRGVYWTAALLSLAWIAGGLLITHLLYGPGVWQMRSAQDVAARPYLILLALGIIIPVIMFWAFAAMMRRAQEMRLAAQSMAELAFRFAEPETMARDRVMMVGQAVRREVAAMGEGIERTLARAVELETLVHTEVNELER
ncbi:MAG TPA: kinesin, partial [Mesorhizobium sp.]|nr:kinesin [Mesorhizobium sp.]